MVSRRHASLDRHFSVSTSSPQGEGRAKVRGAEYIDTPAVRGVRKAAGGGRAGPQRKAAARAERYSAMSLRLSGGGGGKPSIDAGRGLPNL